jgi:NTP pyrophosphatase (non-canonical NTP hydrolase)
LAFVANLKESPKPMKKLITEILKFRNDRDWEQFHDSKNLALALSIEASELNELFLWKNSADDIENVSKTRLAEELADVLVYALLLAEKNDLDIESIILDKLEKNNKKYPVDKSRGNSKKYTDL